MAGGLRFADAGANHFPSFRAWPKTFGDLISSDARFAGHFRAFIPLAAVDPFRPGRDHHILRSHGDGQACQRIAIIPGHPIRRVLLECLGVPQQLGEIVERIDSVELAGVDQAHI